MSRFSLTNSLLFLLVGTAAGFTPSRVPVRTTQTIASTTLFNSINNNDNNINNNNNINDDDDANLPDRRAAMATTAGLITGGVLASTLTTSPAEANNSMPLFVKVKQLETANYMGRIGMPIYPPNSNGDPEKHIPQVVVDGNDVSISAKHIMSEEHFIQFLWLKDAQTDEVVLAKELTPTEASPILKARVPSGVTLRPYLFCNLHGLWKGEDFTVA